MDDAIYLPTKQVLCGEDLWHLKDFHKYDFKCVGCSAPVTAASFGENNKQKPHFRKREDHKPDCTYTEQIPDELLSKALIESVFIHEEGSLPMSYPDRLKINIPKSSQESEDIPPSASKSNRNRTSGGPRRGTSGVGKKHPYVSNSLRMVCKHYLQFPHDRWLPFTADDIDGDTYDSCFLRLIQPSGGQTFRIQPANKIYFAECAWKNPQYVADSDILKITLSRGLWVGNTLRRPFYLHLTEPDQNKRLSFLDEFTRAHEVVKGDKTKKLLVFFVGGQDGKDYFKFNVEGTQQICFWATDKEMRLFS